MVGLVSPASATKRERILECAAFLEKLGYQVTIGKSCFQSFHGYLSGEDILRAEDLNQMFADKQIKGIFCVRGGYGCGRIMEFIDFDMIRQNPKVFVGYSDITSIHLAIQKLCGFVSFHGPMVSSNMLEHYDEYTKQSLEQFLFMRKTDQISFQNPESGSFEIISEGSAEGILIGGNLAVLINSIGTFYAPDFQGKALFLEDVGESIPRIDRMMTQLRLMGVFEQVSAILLGDFAECGENSDQSFGIKELIMEIFGGLNIPVISNIKCGHCFPTATIPLGARCSIDTKMRTIVMECGR